MMPSCKTGKCGRCGLCDAVECTTLLEEARWNDLTAKLATSDARIAELERALEALIGHASDEQIVGNVYIEEALASLTTAAKGGGM